MLTRALTEHTATDWIKRTSFAGGHAGRVGVELEWIIQDVGRYSDRVEFTRSCDALYTGGALPAGSIVSFEPGGQVELSTRPADTLANCVAAASEDLAELRARADRAALRLHGIGLDDRAPARVVDRAWYAELERSYDQFGPWGRVMMSNAASVQISIDPGDDSTGWRGRNRRWLLVNRLGPTLSAMFANSPDGFGFRARSTRQVIRFRTDPTRTDPVPWSGDARADWTKYALDARIVAISRRPVKPERNCPVSLTMRQWLHGAGPRPVRVDDLRRHLKTMIPPVRACGRLELRMIDAQNGDNWVVPVVVAAYLLDNERGFADAEQVACELPVPTRADYVQAAHEGLSVPRLADAAARCMRSVLRGLDSIALPGWAGDQVVRFADRYTLRARCPADVALAREAMWRTTCRQ